MEKVDITPGELKQLLLSLTPSSKEIETPPSTNGGSTASTGAPISNSELRSETGTILLPTSQVIIPPITC